MKYFTSSLPALTVTSTSITTDNQPRYQQPPSANLLSSHNNYPMRETLKEQMILRKDFFLKALTTKNVQILPRLIGKDKTIK